MFKKKIFINILLILFIQICFCTTIWGQEIVWRVGGHFALETPETIASKYFVELVKERTEGKMKIDFYPAEQLGASAEQLDNLKLGIQDANINTIAWLREMHPAYNILGILYLFNDNDHIRRFFETDEYKQIENEVLENSGIRVIEKDWYCGPRVTLLVDPATNIEDLKGRILRMPASIPYVKGFEALGASCTEIAWGEAYSALDSGIVDGMDSPFDSIYGMGFHRVAPYILLTNHLQGNPQAVMVREESWQALPQNIKIIVKEAAKEAGDYYRNLVNTNRDEKIRKMKDEGAVFVEVNITSEILEKIREYWSDLEERDFVPKGLVKLVDDLK
ncbi:MAG: TRAP transporter substrate-binding protein [Eubacteriales bacterium]